MAERVEAEGDLSWGGDFYFIYTNRVMKNDCNEAVGEDTGDDEGDVLPHQVAWATRGTSHGGTREELT
jgi:hypothetical protein